MGNTSNNDSILEEAARMLREGIIPEEVSTRLLWAGMIQRAKTDRMTQQRVERVDKRTLRLMLSTGATLTLILAAISFLAYTLIGHLQASIIP